MSDGSEFHMHAAAVQKACHGNSVLILGTNSSGASDDHRGRTGKAGWIRSLRCSGVEDESTLNVNIVILYCNHCFTNSQWSDREVSTKSKKEILECNVLYQMYFLIGWLGSRVVSVLD